jgi:hypothetical protein
MNEAQAADHDIIVQLRDHLMGSLDVQDYGIPNSSINWGRGCPGARGTPGRTSVEPTSRRQSRS